MQGKFILQGITVSVIGGAIWVMFYLHTIYQGRDRILVVLISAILGLLMASFYLIPLGMLMGLSIPALAHRKSAGFCLVAGFLCGIAVAGVTSLLVAVAFRFNLRSSFLSMCPVCSLLIVGWMLKLRNASIPAGQSAKPPQPSAQAPAGSETAKS